MRLIEGFLLGQAERFNMLWTRFTTMIKTPHLLLVGFKEASLDESRDASKGVTFVQKFITSNSQEIVFGLIKQRQIEKIYEGFLLGWCALKHIKGDMERLLGAEPGSETDEGLCLRAVAIFCFQASRESSLINLANG